MPPHLRRLTLLGRTFARGYASIPKEQGTFQVQRVHISRPYINGGRTRKIITYAAVSAVLVKSVDWLLGDDEDETEETETRSVKEAVKQVRKVAEGEKVGADGGGTELEATETRPEALKGEETEEDEEDELEPEDAIFVPISWPQKMPQRFYKGSDPEWQSFLEFGRDPQRAKAVKNELVGMLLGYFTQDPRLSLMLGIPAVTRRVWLDIDYPYGPPVEYSQTGIEITDDYVALVVRQTDPMTVSRLKSMITPLPILAGLWESYKHVWSKTLGQARKALNLEAPKDNKTKPPDGSLPFAQFHSLQDTFESADEDGSRPKKPANTTREPRSDPQSSPPAPATPTKSPSDWWVNPLPNLPQPSSEMKDVTRIFRKTMAKKWQAPASDGPPRGTFLISGLVELHGRRAGCVLDVRAAYHPGQKQWSAVSVGLRRIQPRKQKPRGGP